MRLDILNRGYSPGTKLLFALIRVFSGHPVPDAAKLVFYRPGFYGAQAKKFTHEAMRGPSGWSVADRELMAAFVSKVNESAFCVGAHTATAGQAYQDGAKVQAVLADLESAPVEDGLRATLRMLGKLTREGKVGAEDMREVLADLESAPVEGAEDIREVLSAGVSRQQVEDALAVCAAFNTTDRLADAFGFELLSPEGFEAGAKYLLKRGYR
jgi:AhpD family alkylhydroperoxidase